MASSGKISRAKGIEIVTELLYAGKHRKEILQQLTGNYGLSESTVDKWMKNARPAVLERQANDNLIRDRINAQAVEDSAKSLNISRERILERLSQIAFGDVRAIFTVDGGLKPISEWPDEAAGMIAGLESFDVTNREGDEVLGTNRKVKTLSPLEAINILNRMLGYNMPEKTELTGKDGQPLPSEFNITLNLK